MPTFANYLFVIHHEIEKQGDIQAISSEAASSLSTFDISSTLFYERHRLGIEERGVDDTADTFDHETRGYFFCDVASILAYVRKVIKNHLKNKKRGVDYASSLVLLD